MNATTESISEVAASVATESDASLLITWIPLNFITGTISSPQAMKWLFELTYYSFFFFITIGVGGNILSFVVFVRRLREKAGAANMYLATLAVCDALHIFSISLFGIMIELPSPINIQWLLDCNFMSMMLFSMGQLSTLLVTTLTIDRCVAIRHPFLYRRIQSKKQAGGTITGLVVFISAAGWHFFGGLHPIEEAELAHTNWKFHCVGRQNLIDLYNAEWYPWIDVIIFWVVPSVIMLVCNIVIIKTIRSETPKKMKEKKSQAEDAPENRTGDISGQTNLAFQKHGRRLTTTALVLSFSYFILVAPVLFYTLISLIADAKGEALPLSEFVVALLDAGLHVIYLINYSCNFWLYCFSTPSFRRDLKKMICGKICDLRCKP